MEDEMKKKRIVLLAAAGIFTSVGIIAATKKKQREAKEKGVHVPYGPYEAVIKRPLDIAMSAGALTLLFPVLGIVGLFVKKKLGSPVIFTQDRPGLHGRIFKIYKFRTMTDQRDSDGNPLSDGERLTPFGAKLRSASIDELPELINILKGDMSVVGPRPLLAEYLERYDSRQKHRHDVRPGLTGFAQVSGRNAVSWEEKFKDDIRYVNHITFLTDLKIILNTIKTVLKKDGINSGASPTMEIFEGNT